MLKPNFPYAFVSLLSLSKSHKNIKIYISPHFIACVIYILCIVVGRKTLQCFLVFNIHNLNCSYVEKVNEVAMGKIVDKIPTNFITFWQLIGKKESSNTHEWN